MRKLVLFGLLLAFCLMVEAQTYNSSNSITRVALVYYFMDENGFYQKKENVNLQEVFQVVSTYGYDKKSHELYVQTERANCIVTVNDDLHKIMKKSKSIPQMKGDELMAKAAEVNNQLDAHFKHLNEVRQKHINDSIQKAKEDSIKKAREDSIRIATENKKADEYRNTHKWILYPTGKVSLYCVYCEKNVTTRDTSLVYKVKQDTIYWLEYKTGKLDIDYEHIHAAKISSQLQNNPSYQYHTKVFADSIESNFNDISVGVISKINDDYFFDYMKELKKEAPNGLFLDWGWNDEYSFITFHFDYMNTNKNTIKYIEVFWKVTNDVGDVRKTGSFKGTGPLEEWESASWNWDSSMYYVAGDATNMDITKVIITYMNGSKVTIPKSRLCFDY